MARSVIGSMYITYKHNLLVQVAKYKDLATCTCHTCTLFSISNPFIVILAVTDSFNIKNLLYWSNGVIKIEVISILSKSCELFIQYVAQFPARSSFRPLSVSGHFLS